jgi:very-short-patch-repair endonuclease
MLPVEQCIRSAGSFLRRRDLLVRGYRDGNLRAALAARRVFRVRHGWYSVPDARESAIQAVRVGGRLTATSALLEYGLRVPKSEVLHVAVSTTACRLRSSLDRRTRLSLDGRVRVYWVERHRAVPPPIGPARSAAAAERTGDVWRVSLDDALVAVLRTEPRDVAVACCSAVMRYKRWGAARLAAVFERAPSRVRCWQSLVSSLDDSHGETFARLWMIDTGIAFVQQARVGAGRIDFQVGPKTYLEIDGGQHDPAWTGEGPSNWEKDLDRGLDVAVEGGAIIRVSYRMLYSRWDRILAAIERSVADDLALLARRRRHPYRPRTRRKRRRSGGEPSW